MFTPADVNIQRMLDEIEALSHFGVHPGGGVSRYTFSPAHIQATNQVAAWMQAAGLQVFFDRWGNLYGRTSGLDDTTPVILTGSHVDSVPNGGNYDGPLGVLSSLEAVRMILERGVPLKKPLQVVSFIEEEGASFLGLMGSSLAIGHLNMADVADLTNRIDQAYSDLLAGVEFPHPVLADYALNAETVDAYIELHIEQGRRLESAGVPIGAVTGIAGPNFMRFRLDGRSDHAGATAYADRRDTLLAAAEIAVGVREIGASQFDGQGHMTVGKLDVQPNVANVVAGVTQFTVDFRAVDDATSKAMEAALLALVKSVSARHTVTFTVEHAQHVSAAHTPARVLHAVQSASVNAGVAYQNLVSWAAHDAMHLAQVVDSGMVFVPSQDGRSHCPEEFTSSEDIAAGAAVMANTLLNLME